MNATSIFGRRNPLRYLATVLLGLVILGQIPVRAATDSARVVKYGQNVLNGRMTGTPDTDGLPEFWSGSVSE